MAAKTKTPKPDNRLLIELLQQRWFAIALKENYPKTPEVSAELDKIEAEVKRLS